MREEKKVEKKEVVAASPRVSISVEILNVTIGILHQLPYNQVSDVLNAIQNDVRTIK